MGDSIDIRPVLDGALKNNKGRLTRKNLEEITKGLEKSGNKEAAMLTNMITSKVDFFEADRNQDGVLDESEITKFDENEDGKITEKELDYFRIFSTKIGHFLQMLFKQNNGFISSGDLRNKADELDETGKLQKEAALLRRLAVGDTFGKLAWVQKGRDARDYGFPSDKKIPSKYIKVDLGRHAITNDLMVEGQEKELAKIAHSFEAVTIDDILALEQSAPRP